MRLYFYKIRSETGETRWAADSYESKADVSKNLGEVGVFNILSAEQLLARFSGAEAKRIARSILVDKPRLIDEMPDEILDVLLKN